MQATNLIYVDCEYDPDEEAFCNYMRMKDDAHYYMVDQTGGDDDDEYRHDCNDHPCVDEPLPPPSSMDDIQALLDEI